MRLVLMWVGGCMVVCVCLGAWVGVAVGGGVGG